MEPTQQQLVTIQVDTLMIYRAYRFSAMLHMAIAGIAKDLLAAHREAPVAFDPDSPVVQMAVIGGVAKDLHGLLIPVYRAMTGAVAKADEEEDKANQARAERAQNN